MSVIATARTMRRLSRSQWLDSDGIRALQTRKLRALVDHAYATVPYYRTLFDGAGVTPEDIRAPEDLSRLPVTTKATLLDLPPDQIVSSAFPAERLISETTSGSTGRPFTMRFDRPFQRARNALFLRALTTAGYRLGKRLMLITADAGKPSRRWLGWRYASIEDAPEQLLAQLNAFRPDVLYGCMTPLRQLASLIVESGTHAHRPSAVISTAEALDDRTRRLLKQAFDAAVHDVYGLTEMGLVAWECGAHDGYHLAEDTTIVEFTPTDDGQHESLVMTNLELMGMPLIRYQTGDLGVPGPAGTCSCGRSLRRLSRVEGRLLDSVLLADGRTISPYRFTLAIEQVPGISRYQVLQNDIDRFVVRAESDGADNAATSARLTAIIADLVGPNAAVEVRYEDNLDPPAGRKFRVVESRLTQTTPA